MAFTPMVPRGGRDAHRGASGRDQETRLQYAGGLPEDTGEESLAE